MRAIIYIRVSRPDQKPENQLPALRQIAVARGLELVGEPIIEKASGSKVNRKGLTELIERAHRGEFTHVLCWAIDRLGRNMQAVVKTITDLDALGCKIISHQEPWLVMDGPVRHLLIAIFGWAAEQERARLIERSMAGLVTARAKGVVLGRPRRSIDLSKARVLQAAGKSLRESAAILGVGPATLHRALKAG